MTSSTTDTRPMIFISHASKDDVDADRVAAGLQAAGFATWVDHQHGIEPGMPNWDRAIRAALPECTAAVLVMTSRSLASDICAAECITIRELSKPLYVAYLDTVKPDEIWLYIKMIQYADLRGDFDAGMQAIVRVLKGKTDEIRPDDPTPIRGKVTGYDVMREHLPYLTTVPLTGRDADLAAIQGKLGQHVTQITAVGGTGKSRVAAEIALSHSTGAVWHRCSGDTQAGDVVELLRQHLGLPKEAQPDDVFAQLERTAAPLIAIDNAEDVPDTEPARREAYVRLMSRLTGLGPVLLTSRVAWHQMKPRIEHILEPLEDVTTAAKIATEFAEAEKVTLDDAAALATAALKHPRLIEFAVRQLHERSLKQVLRQLRELKHEEVEEALTEMIRKTVEQMHEQAKHGAAAEALLKRLTVFRGSFDEDATAALKPETMDEDGLEDALVVLQRWGFVRRDGATNRYRIDDVVIGAMPADETASRHHFDYYYKLHGDYDTNANHERHPQIEADWQNIRTALAWGLSQDDKGIAEAAVDFVIELDYPMQFRVSRAERKNWLEQARIMAVKSGDRWYEGRTLYRLGEVARMQNEYAQALDYYQQAQQAFIEIGSRLGQANVLQSLGQVAYMQDEYAHALDYYQQAQQAFIDIGSRLGQAHVLKRLGDVAYMQDEYAQALDYYQQAQQAYTEIGDRLGQAQVLQRLGDVARMQKEYAQALDYLKQAQQAYTDIGDRLGQAQVLQSLGDVARIQNEYAQALDYYQQAQQAFSDIGDRLGQAQVLQSLGDVARRQNQFDDGRSYYQQALQLAGEIGELVTQLNSLRQWGNLERDAENIEQACDLYQRADALAQTNSFYSNDAVTQYYRQVMAELGCSNAEDAESS